MIYKVVAIVMSFDTEHATNNMASAGSLLHILTMSRVFNGDLHVWLLFSQITSGFKLMLQYNHCYLLCFNIIMLTSFNIIIMLTATPAK